MSALRVAGLLTVLLAAGCAGGATKSATSTQSSTSVGAVASTTTAPTVPDTTTTTLPSCSLGGNGTGQTVPVSDVCSSAGAPHFDTPQEAMTYLADAWNANDVRQIDYVTNPAGRNQMDSMAAQMVHLKFKSCTANPTGDYTCYFTHDVAPSTSPTTYPNPGNYPPGEAVFTVAPANGPGWYLTFVIHCG
jgi:hypothetical protein